MELVSLHRNLTCPHHRPLTHAAFANRCGDWLVTGHGVARALNHPSINPQFHT